jgi:hypothetical protein
MFVHTDLAKTSLVVTPVNGREIVCAFHDIDGTHSLIRNWPPVMSRVLHDTAVNGIPVLENWQVTMADIGIEKLHYHIPGDVDPERTVLYVKDASGSWAQREFTVEGSYMIFPFVHGEMGFALEVLPEEGLSVAAIVLGAGAAALLVALGLSRKRKVKKGTAGGK